MKKHRRRKFLSYLSQLSAMTLLVPTLKCSRKSSVDKEEVIINSKEETKMINLKEEVQKLLKAGKEIKLTWDCGGDEAIITTFFDGKRMDFNNPLVSQLDMYLLNFLNLPDVGEFSMEGEGKLIEEGEKVYIEYESIMKGYADYDELGGGGDWKEVNEREPMYSGKKELFTEEKK